MNNTPNHIIEEIYLKQKEYFYRQQTKNIDFRLNQLKKLKAAINKNSNEILDALWKDLHKSNEEAYLTEISIVTQEIDNHIKNLENWASPQRVSTPIHLFPSRSKILYEPLGLALIIAPWNYPFQLTMNPLVGAISSGCCAILKPSPNAPNISEAMNKMIAETFDESYIALVEGELPVNQELLKKQFDIIFFTGSSRVGKIIMHAAAETLTPVILELGGKSPCIVDKDANIDIAAKRIAWGKTINAGQTCIAPDYLYVHESIKDKLLEKIEKNIRQMFGENIQKNEYYPRIISEEATQRLEKLMSQGDIYSGGYVDVNDKFIEPTIIDNIKPEHDIMQEEIFGPILPVLTYNKIDEVINYINNNDKPLALYYFGKNKMAKEVLSRTSSGGGCINDTLLHISNHKLPFGGVGNSGLGKYHGKDSFLAFSNQKSIISSSIRVDFPFKYVPFKFFNWIRRII